MVGVPVSNYRALLSPTQVICWVIHADIFVEPPLLACIKWKARMTAKIDKNQALSLSHHYVCVLRLLLFTFRRRGPAENRSKSIGPELLTREFPRAVTALSCLFDRVAMRIHLKHFWFWQDKIIP